MVGPARRAGRGRFCAGKRTARRDVPTKGSLRQGLRDESSRREGVAKKGELLAKNIQGICECTT